MKRITLGIISICFAITFGASQTTLTAGDIAITGFNSDNPDEFTFVLLTDVVTNTQIRFTDRGWISSGSFRTSGEGVIVWTATSNLSCGTEITVTDNTPFSVSSGSITDSNQFGLATNGDQILAYQGTDAAPSFIYAIHFGNGGGWTNATNAQSTALPIGLTDAVNAVYVGFIDNGTYDCSTTTNQLLVLAAVSNSTNWTLNNTRITTLAGCTYTCVTCPSTVTWDGSWMPAAPTSANAVIIDADYNTGTHGNITACSLTIISGNTLAVTDNNYIDIEEDITVNGTGEITVSRYGSVVQNNNTATTTISDPTNGRIAVTKETAPINAWYEYTYWSSPVSGETIGDTFFATNADRRYLFNAENYKDSFAETNNDNTAVAGQDDVDDNFNDWQLTAAVDVMQPGVGYAATLSPASFVFAGVGYAHVFEGPFNNGTYNVPVYRNDAETADTNWNFVGNPYPSTIDVDLFFSENNYDAMAGSGTTDGAIYLWSQNTIASGTNNGNSGQNFNTSDYATINGSGEVAGGDGITPNRYIPSGQGFFLSYNNNGDVISSTTNADGDTISEGEVTFTNNMRVTGNNNQFFRNTNTSVNNNKIWLNLTSDNGVFSQILIAYLNGATNGNDGAFYDARRNISTGMAAFMYSAINGDDTAFSIQGKASESITINEVIHLGLYTTITDPTLYTISIAQFEGEFFNNNTVYLIDNVINTTHNLSNADYTFTSDTGNFNNRFQIVFNTNTLSTDTFDLDTNSVSIIELENDTIQFTVPQQLTIASIKIYDTLGRQLYNGNGVNNTNIETINLSLLKSNIFIAKVELSNGQTISKKAIKK